MQRMTIETSVATAGATSAEFTGEGATSGRAPPALFASPHDALMAAIGQFVSQAAFYRALTARATMPLTKAAVSQWIRRKNGAPSDFAPDIEAISDVPVEWLRPGVGWEVLRASVGPPTYRPRLPGKG